jgi:hypothetical protein
VRSTTPELLDLQELAADDAPVWIIGGGKTAMDAAHRIITALPGREVNMAVGPGTYFLRRDAAFPTGLKRWFTGTLPNTALREVARRFDGTNEDDVRTWHRATHGVCPTEQAGHFFGAYLSDGEADVLRRGLHDVEHEHVADVVDRDGDVELAFRTGRARTVPAGAWIVNCTGSLLRTSHPYEPYASAGGRTLSIQMRSAVVGPFSSFGGYYLTHLLFLDKLRIPDVYELDVEDLNRKASAVVMYASVSLAMHNLALVAPAVPKKVMLGCGLDFDRWYPMHRRVIGTADFLRHRVRDLEHHRRALDTVRERFGVRCGPLPAA